MDKVELYSYNARITREKSEAIAGRSIWVSYDKAVDFLKRTKGKKVIVIKIIKYNEDDMKEIKKRHTVIENSVY